MWVKKVLAVDDEELFCRLVKKELESRGGTFEVLTAHDGASAIRLARSEKPDVILLDIMMPGMAGTEVAEELLENPLTCSIPIIFVTAIVRGSEIGDAGGYVANRLFVSKPVMIGELVEKINMVLGLPPASQETSETKGWFLT